jgi:hypothetical protein
MLGMAHEHSAMHHSAVGDMSLGVQADSCQSDCAVAERQNNARKVVPQLRVAQTGVLVLVASHKFLDRDLENRWNLDSGPPSFPSQCLASHSVLRI